MRDLLTVRFLRYRRGLLGALAAALALIGVIAGASPTSAASVGTPTGLFVGGRVTSADGVMTKGSAVVSAPDANFTSADVGFGLLSTGIPAGAIIVSVNSSTSATLSSNATKSATGAVFAIAGSFAAQYGWGEAAMPDGSILVGDYWNNRILHYNANGTPAAQFVFTKSKVGFGTNTNQEPFGICVDGSSGPFHGYVYMTEGSLYNVIQYDPNGNWVTSWGTTNAAHSVAFTYPSQCVVNPSNGLVYISNQLGKSVVVLNPSTNAATFVAPPSPNTFIQPRGMAFDSIGNIWIADQGHHRIDIYNPACLQNPWPSTGCSYIKTVLPPGGVSTTFDMRGLAIDTTSTPNLMFVTNGQNCLVQEFNADPAGGTYPAITPANNYGFILNFNNVPSGGSDCGTPGQLGQNGQFEDGARGLAVDGNHHVWAGDLADFRTEVFDESGSFLNHVPTAWPNGSGSSPVSLPPGGGFNGPRGAAFDGNGAMYVTDTYNERTEQFTPDGHGGYRFAMAWGMRGNGPGNFNYPRLLCWDPVTSLLGGGKGALIVANTDSNMVTAWNPYKAGGPAVVWSQSTLSTPYGVACDPSSGLVYVANSNANDIVVLNSDGSVAGTMGTGIITGFPRGIAVDPNDASVWIDAGANSKTYHFASWTGGGAYLSSFTVSSGGTAKCTNFGIAPTANYLYIACPSANDVVQYTRAGKLAGTLGAYGAFGLVGTMQTPQGLTMGPDGKLYVVEQGSNRISSWTVPL